MFTVNQANIDKPILFFSIFCAVVFFNSTSHSSKFNNYGISNKHSNGVFKDKRELRNHFLLKFNKSVFPSKLNYGISNKHSNGVFKDKRGLRIHFLLKFNNKRISELTKLNCSNYSQC